MNKNYNLQKIINIKNNMQINYMQEENNKLYKNTNK